MLQIVSFLIPFAMACQLSADDHALARQIMLDDIARLVVETRSELGKSALDPKVMAAMAKVPRHQFVDRDDQTRAYKNRPLPIGGGQTISQPYMVAVMTDLLQVQASDRVLEIGTGSGYQAAILAELAREVFTIEIVEPLGREAASRLKSYTNIKTRIGDGYRGWPEHAPYDGIIVTAVAERVPPALIEQLKPGGRMVIPLGSSWWGQELVLVEKAADGAITQKPILPVRFVPLTGDH